MVLVTFAIRVVKWPVSALIDVRLFSGPVFRAVAATQFLSDAINFGGSCRCRSIS